jgi:acyl-CoA thioesterase-1
LAGGSLLPFNFAQGNDAPASPKVFIIGDSISIGYTPVVRKALEGKAIVTRPSRNCNGTKLGIEKIDEWLGTEKYDLIHFNFGLHDMKRVDPITGEGTNNAAHPVQSELPVYESNLEFIVKRLEATGAVLVFATTTPVPEKNNRVMREPRQVLEYNETALRIMNKHKILVNDLYSFAQPLVAAHQNPNDVHFTEKGYALLGEEVARYISATLKLPDFK